MLRIIDSGEATRFPTYAAKVSTAWSKVADQPSSWQIKAGPSSGSALGVITGEALYGTTCFKLVSGATRYCAMRRLIPGTTSETYTSFYFKVDALDARDIFQLTDSSSTPVISMRLRQDSSGNILVYAGTTLKATIITGWASNEWHQIRLHQKISTNTLELKLDTGATEDCSGTAMTTPTYLTIGNPDNTTASARTLWIDCIQVNDATGSLNNSWPDSPQIPSAIRPDADDGTYTDWIRSSGSADYDMIDEIAPDLDTTYVYSNNDSDRSVYGFTDLAEPSNTVIVGVCLTIVAKRTDGAQLIPLVARAGNLEELDPVDVGTDYMTPIEIIIETDPIASGPWTQTNLNATSFGFKHHAL